MHRTRAVPVGARRTGRPAAPSSRRRAAGRPERAGVSVTTRGVLLYLESQN